MQFSNAGINSRFLLWQHASSSDASRQEVLDMSVPSEFLDGVIPSFVLWTNDNDRGAWNAEAAGAAEAEGGEDLNLKNECEVDDGYFPANERPDGRKGSKWRLSRWWFVPRIVV